MTRQLLPFCLAWMLALTYLSAQETTVYTEALRHYKEGVEQYEKGSFGKARFEFDEALTKLQPVNEPRADLLRSKAELKRAQTSILLEEPDAEARIMDFLRTYRPDPITDQALLEVGNFYFNDRDYDKALAFLQEIPTQGLPRDQRTEIKFKMGYAHFVNKDFDEAQAQFADIADFQGEYYHPSNYYLGLCHFFAGDYQEAIDALRIAEEEARYRRHIPYYLAQIYFAEGRYEDLIREVEPRIEESRRYEEELHQLVGQSYFELGDYARALPHLEAYSRRSSSLRQEEFYQLGYTQYQTGRYADAIESLKPLSTVNSAIGQNAMYYLGDAYLKSGNPEEALLAFGEARRSNFNPVITQEAIYNYGKLAYQLDRVKTAIQALQSLPPDSPYYAEAQDLIAEMILNYREFEEALDILADMPQGDPKVVEALQQVHHNYGLQSLREGKLDRAREQFEQSLLYPEHTKLQATATYWLADIAHRQEDYAESIAQTNRFLSLARQVSDLPEETSALTAQYLQGYNYFKQEKYAQALPFFQEAVEGIKRNRRFIENEDISSRLLGDATLRTGDCYFKRNLYGQAVQYYDEAINAQYADYVYAIYQKAIIEGLRGRRPDKIRALQRIAREFPNSTFAPNALFQLGSTYQEMGRLDLAGQPLQELVDRYSSRSDLVKSAYLKLGLIQYNQGNLNAAIANYQQVFEHNPEPSEAQLALAALEEIYVEDMGRPNDYFAFLERIPGYRVDNLARDSINFRAAANQYETGAYDRAIQAYTNYLQQFPNGAYVLEAHYQRGESYGVQRQYSEALADYRWVVNRGPSAYYLRAAEKAAIIAYNHEQDFNAAYQLYARMEEAAVTEEQRFEAQLGALRSAYRTNNREAVYRLANAVAGNDNATSQQVATAYFYLGKLAYDQGDLESALNAFNQVIERSDNEQTAEARYLKTSILYQRGDLDRAQQLAMAANKQSSAYPYWVAKSVILLADILTAKGDLYNARAALEALLDNYEGDAQLIEEARQKRQALERAIEADSRLNLQPDSSKMEFTEENQNN